jgi:hypothetical protein
VENEPSRSPKPHLKQAISQAEVSTLGGPRFNPNANDAQDRSIATLEILSASGADVNARITDVASRTDGAGSTLPERGGQTASYAYFTVELPKRRAPGSRSGLAGLALFE